MSSVNVENCSLILFSWDLQCASGVWIKWRLHQKAKKGFEMENIPIWYWIRWATLWSINFTTPFWPLGFSLVCHIICLAHQLGQIILFDNILEIILKILQESNNIILHMAVWAAVKVGPMSWLRLRLLLCYKCDYTIIYRARLKGSSQVWWFFLLLLFTTSAWLSLQHSRNLLA